MVKVISDKRKKEIASEILDNMFMSLKGKHFLITSLINSGCDVTHLNEHCIYDIPKVFAQCFWLEDNYLEKVKSKDNEIKELKEKLETEKCISKNLMKEIKEQEEIIKRKNKNLSQEDLDLEYLVERDKILTKLEIGGVDNWEWYEESLK